MNKIVAVSPPGQANGIYKAQEDNSMMNIKRHIPAQHRLFFFYCILIFLLSAMMGCAYTQREQADSLRNISFSPDGKTLIFNRQTGDGPYLIHTYDMESGDLTAYASPAGEKWDYPHFSFNGKQIVFVSFPVDVIPATDIHAGKTIENPDKSQIAVMDANGKNVRKITRSNGYKAYPSFSHSGRKIIFARSDVMEDKPLVGIKWTLCETDVKTGRETSLTEFKFFTVSKPYYFPDDKTFIFGGEYLTGYPGAPDSNKDTESFRRVEKKRKELKSKYNGNSIYVMQEGEKELKPYLAPPKIKKRFKKALVASDYTKWPSLNTDGSVLIFKAQGSGPDGAVNHDHLYQYSPDGNHRSITSIPPTDSMPSVSPDGESIAVISVASNSIMLYQVKDGKNKEITLPDQPSRIINGK